MSSHRDFTPDDDQDELLLAATAAAHREHQDQPGEIDAELELLNESVPSGAGVGPSRKRVLSNPMEPPPKADDGAQGGGRKRAKVVPAGGGGGGGGAGKKAKRTSKIVPADAEPRPPTPPSPSMYMEDGDDLLADELSLMDEEVAKRSTRGSSPHFRDLTPLHHRPSAEYNGARLGSLPVPTMNDGQDEHTRARQTASSSPEITLLEGKTPQPASSAGGVLVPLPAPAPAPARTGAPLRRKKKSWLQTSKTVPIAIAPNPQQSVQAAGGGGGGGSSTGFTPEPPAQPAGESKRKPAAAAASRKSRAIKSSAVVLTASSPQVEAILDGEAYGVPPEMYHLAPEGGIAGMSVDGISDVGSEVKPKKKKSKKLKPGEVGPGKHW